MKKVCTKIDEAVSSCTRHEALELFQSHRGRYIVGQALYIASKKLRKTEPSNSYDMRILGRLFDVGWQIEASKPHTANMFMKRPDILKKACQVLQQKRGGYNAK